MGWKLFALFNILVTCHGITDPDTYSLVRTPELVIEVVSTIGLVLMAFEFNFLPCNFWRGFAGAYFAYSFIMLPGLFIGTLLYERYAMDGETFLACALFHFAVSYGLWLYGSKRDRQGDVRQLTA
ncbi:hypothetical protein GWG65_39750 [Bradyrhizobium sp. CSA207]|uniref:hypothetical protein n=1 Tax=Bradyrhizobium sp. CSA207 TaxID=2698826 RepID=UPI0023AEF859|nr:hypothetical protein [Bradyrhizobium sp. CSA207]MDE5447329.1 hypothetical protein [Bradyrhizobium sp. CSA207]